MNAAQTTHENEDELESDESMDASSSEEASDADARAESDSSEEMQDEAVPTLVEPNGEYLGEQCTLYRCRSDLILMLIGYSASTCGYCSTGNRELAARTSRSYGSKYHTSGV
jgi:hypothetical protein